MGFLEEDSGLRDTCYIHGVTRHVPGDVRLLDFYNLVENRQTSDSKDDQKHLL
jgi:hypothetical protein